VIGWKADRARDVAVIEVIYNQFRDWQSGSRSFSHLAAVGSSTWSTVLEGSGNPTRLAVSAVSASLFDTLGTPPLRGCVLSLPRRPTPRSNTSW
jgi:hypothetical protein